MFVFRLLFFLRVFFFASSHSSIKFSPSRCYYFIIPLLFVSCNYYDLKYIYFVSVTASSLQLNCLWVHDKTSYRVESVDCFQLCFRLTTPCTRDDYHKRRTWITEHFVFLFFSYLRSLAGNIVYDPAGKAFWSSILPNTSRFDVQFLLDDLRYFQFYKCELHARGHVQHKQKITYAFVHCAWHPFASTVVPAMSSAVLLGWGTGGLKGP